jgi:anaerobic sulfite reductase subunit C
MEFNNLYELKRIGIIQQKQKDYYLIRIKSIAGDLTAKELVTISTVAEKYGNGKIHLTTRQGVEIHNIHKENVNKAKEELEQGGIVLGACGPRGRGIVACPGAETCKYGIICTKGLAKDLDSLYFRKEAPAKFKISVTGCPNNCAKANENDIGIMGGVLPKWDKGKCIDCSLCTKVCPTSAIDKEDSTYILNLEKCILCGICINNCPVQAWEPEKKGYTLFLGGTMGKKPRLGTKAKILIQDETELKKFIYKAFEFYKREGRKKERFGHTLDRYGLEKALKEILDE